MTLSSRLVRARHRTLATPLLLLAAVSAVAENAADNDQPIDEIVVIDRYLSLDQVNSAKTPTPVINIPQSLSITTSEQIEAQAFQSMGDILRYTPGLAISQGEGHRDAIIIRGIQTTADFFVDGVRDDVQYYRPLYNVQQVEVLRGPNALLFGRGGGGGVINRVQKRALVDDDFVTLNAGFDSFGAYSGMVDANIAVTDRSAVRVNAFYQDLNNHRDFFGGDTFAINPTATLELGYDTLLTLSYEYITDDRVVDRGVPSVVTAGGPNVPLEGFQDTFFGSPDQNFTTLDASLFRARLEHDFADNVRANFTFQYADYDKAYQNLYPSDAVAVSNGTFDTVELDGYRDTTDRQNLILQGNLVAQLETGRIGHTLLLGFETGQQDTANARQDNVFATNNDDQDVIDFSDPLQLPAFAFSLPVRDRDSDVRFTSLYLQDQIDLTSNFKLLVGLRFDEFDINVFDRIEANDGDALGGDFSRTDSEVTPRLGAIYKPSDTVSLYASYSETFLPRSGDQFLTLNLDTESTRPQTFENREVGAKWTANDRLSVAVALFDLDRESYTSIDPEDQEQLIVIGGSQTQGFEVELLGSLTDFWTINASYSNLDGEIVVADGSGQDGNATRQTPENMFAIWNTFRVSDALQLSLGATYQDSFFTTEDNTVEVPSYTRVDAAAFYRLSDRVQLQLNIENLLDETYFPDAHSNTNITTGEPVNARLSAIVSF